MTRRQAGLAVPRVKPVLSSMGPLDALWHLANLFVPALGAGGAGGCLRQAAVAARPGRRELAPPGRSGRRSGRAGHAGRPGACGPRRQDGHLRRHGAGLRRHAVVAGFRARAALTAVARSTGTPRSECGSACGDVHVDHLPDQPRRLRAAVEIDDAVALGAAHQFAAHRLRDGPSTRMRCTVPTRLALMRRTLSSMAACSCCRRLQLHRLRRVVGQRGGRRARARAEDEAEASCRSRRRRSASSSCRSRPRSRRGSRR